MELLKNKQFWVAVLALIQTIVLNYLHVPAEIWAAIDAILVIVIGVYTVEQVETIKAESAKEIARLYSETLNRSVNQLVNQLSKKE